jgi:hypothetical protein
VKTSLLGKNFTPGGKPQPWGKTSTLGNKVHPWGETEPLGSKFKTGLGTQIISSRNLFNKIMLFEKLIYPALLFVINAFQEYIPCAQVTLCT